MILLHQHCISSETRDWFDLILFKVYDSLPDDTESVPLRTFLHKILRKTTLQNILLKSGIENIEIYIFLAIFLDIERHFLYVFLVSTFWNCSFTLLLLIVTLSNIRSLIV
jgi:hypothetical protein